ncbi:MAG: HK97 gp10 family phage protein [Lachnospiraceae bacterium]|nr:HK97 gp10 family phage protein [Lachnospiraceae bacterium]
MSVEFQDNRIEVKNAIGDAAIAFLHEACGELEAQTKRNSKVKTGQTKGSYNYAVDEAELTGYVGSNYENAIWEEFGTGEYALNGDGRKGGWRYMDEKGEWHFTKGKRPRRPLFKAFTSLKGRIAKRAEQIIKERMDIQ